MDYESVARQVASEFECDHSAARVTRRVFSNGSVHYPLQCQHCGITIRTLKHAEVSRSQADGAIAWNPDLHDEWFESKNARRREIACEERAREKSAWDEGYEAYRQGPEWRKRRDLVMRRAQGTCEGCGMSRATQVHHLTYANVGREMLFELVAVCRSCHELIHDKVG